MLQHNWRLFRMQSSTEKSGTHNQQPFLTPRLTVGCWDKMKHLTPQSSWTCDDNFGESTRPSPDVAVAGGKSTATFGDFCALCRLQTCIFFLLIQGPSLDGARYWSFQQIPFVLTLGCSLPVGSQKCVSLLILTLFGIVSLLIIKICTFL